jgi:hypothetical protein
VANSSGLTNHLVKISFSGLQLGKFYGVTKHLLPLYGVAALMACVSSTVAEPRLAQKGS